jgi:hypothetical protein
MAEDTYYKSQLALSIRRDITINADEPQCRIMGEEIDDNSSTKAYQFQTISNLYNSGIPSEIISLQLDITEEEVEETLEKIENKRVYPLKLLLPWICFT